MLKALLNVIADSHTLTCECKEVSEGSYCPTLRELSGEATHLLVCLQASEAQVLRTILVHSHADI